MDICVDGMFFCVLASQTYQVTYIPNFMFEQGFPFCNLHKHSLHTNIVQPTYSVYCDSIDMPLVS